MNELIGLILGLVLFLCTISAYITGIKHGKQISQAIIPKMDLNPVKKAVGVIEQHKQEKKVEEELTDIMGATKESMLKALKSEVK